MSTKYKATTTDEAYFITITTVGWIDPATARILSRGYKKRHLFRPRYRANPDRSDMCKLC